MTGNEIVEERRRGDRTAARIETIAVDLVLEHGLHNVTVDDICERAKISQRTFFNHFRTKEEAVFGSDIQGVDEVAAREFLASGSHDLLADTIRLMAATMSRHGDRELFLKRKRIMHSDPALIGKHMERMRSVRGELRELIFMRIKNAAPEHETEAQTRMVAALFGEMSGVMLRLSMAENSDAAALAQPHGAGARLLGLLARGLA